MEETPASLIARFLRANHYTATLSSFLAEANLPPETGSDTSSSALTIEQVLREKQVFDVSVQFERAALDGQAERAWRLPAPTSPAILDLPSPTNILNVSLEQIYTPSSPTSPVQALFISTASRQLHVFSPVPPYAPLDIPVGTSDAPLLSWTVLASKLLVTTAMSGRVALHRLPEGELLDERRDHAKYVVRIATWEDASGAWLATAGWDMHVQLYRLPLPFSYGTRLGEPVAHLATSTLPESIHFTAHPELEQPVLVLTRRDSTHLHFYRLPSPSDIYTLTEKSELELLGRQNLAPHSNAWVAFTPAAVAPHPADPGLLAVGTSHTPHMKLIIVKLLLPPADGDSELETTPVPEANTRTALLDPAQSATAALARRQLAIQDREDAALQSVTSTLAPQSAFSTPAVAWRPDGSGVWVNGDDGAVRGIEAASGKVVATLTGGHAAATKVRTLCAGHVDGHEVLVSGGFDRRAVLWSVPV